MMEPLHICLDDRKRAVLAAMAQAGLDLLVIGSNGLNHIDQSNPVAHLTHFRSIGPSLLLLDASGATTMLANPRDDAERIAAYRFDACEATNDLAAAFDKHLPTQANRLGLVGLRAMPRKLIGAIAPATAHAVDFTDIFMRVTARKTSHEIAAARRAVAIAEKGLTKLLAGAHPGRRECDLALEVNLTMKALGADDCFLMLNAGPRADAVMPSTERRIEAGDLILCELSPSVDGQYVQICRTISVGAPAPIIVEKYALLVAAMHEGIARVKPGARMGDVCAAIDDHLSNAGYAQYSRPPFIRRRGHGLGSGSFSPGDVAVDNAAILEPGMVFVVHPNQFLPETGYMMCGEPVLVTHTGVEILSLERARLIVAGPEARP